VPYDPISLILALTGAPLKRFPGAEDIQRNEAPVVMVVIFVQALAPLFNLDRFCIARPDFTSTGIQGRLIV
jgi:hypothetical protein